MKIKNRHNQKNAEQLLKMAGLDSDTIAELEFWGYFRAPASKGHHLAVPGGLVQHSINVTTRLVALTKALHQLAHALSAVAAGIARLGQ